MRIQNNIMAINSHRQLGINTGNQMKSTEKLSSGFRINRAADDAAGLSISEKMRAQIRGLSMASKNAQDGVSLIQAAEGSLQEAENILQRMRELAVQAANDTNETEDRGAIQNELNSLTAEVDRIAYTTEFNKKAVLDGSLSADKWYSRPVGNVGLLNISSNYAPGNVAYGTITASVATAGQIGTQTLQISSTGLSSVNGQIVIGGGGTSSTAAGVGATGITPITVEIKSGMSKEDIANAITAKLNSTTEFRNLYEASVQGDTITIKGREVGSIAAFTANASTSGVATMVTSGLTASGTNAGWSINTSGTAVTGTFYFGGTKLAEANGVSMSFTDLKVATTDVLISKKGAELTLQVGANTGKAQTIGIGIDNLTAGGLGIDRLDVSTHRKSQTAIDSIEGAIQKVSNQRSGLGAVQNRLEYTIKNLDTVNENLTAAESRIRDTDMAKEMMNFTKNNILTQASTAMLAQANMAPQGVLQLLQ